MSEPYPPAGKYITLYHSQRAALKMWRQKEYMSRLSQDKKKMKVKLLELLELQELVVWLVGNHNKWCRKFLAAAQNPAVELAPGTPAPPGAWDYQQAR